VDRRPRLHKPTLHCKNISAIFYYTKYVFTSACINIVQTKTDVLPEHKRTPSSCIIFFKNSLKICVGHVRSAWHTDDTLIGVRPMIYRYITGNLPQAFITNSNIGLNVYYYSYE